MLTLARIDPPEGAWKRLDACPDRVLFQTRAWLSFVAATQGAEPVIAEIKDGNEHVGLFTGLVIRRYGIRILGSPFPGWTTPYMGFNVREGVSRGEAAQALVRFAFDTLGCMHLELKDRRLAATELEGLGFERTPEPLFEIDLTRSDDELLAGMASACRRCIRKAEREGVTVEESNGDGFAEEYYAQLQDVFAKQSLRPTYDCDRVRALIRNLQPTGNLLLVRALDSDGRCIATGIFPAMNGVMYFWGGASWRQHQILRPNEAVFWYAMRHWKARGMTAFDMGGGGDYKRKYGPRELEVDRFTRSRFAGVSALRNAAKRVYETSAVLRARLPFGSDAAKG